MSTAVLERIAEQPKKADLVLVPPTPQAVIQEEWAPHPHCSGIYRRSHLAGSGHDVYRLRTGMAGAPPYRGDGALVKGFLFGARDLPLRRSQRPCFQLANLPHQLDLCAVQFKAGIQICCVTLVLRNAGIFFVFNTRRSAFDLRMRGFNI